MDEKKYFEAPDVEREIQRVLEKYNDTFYNIRKVGFKAIYRIPERCRGEKVVYGSTSTVSEKMRLFIDADFLIEIWKDGWDASNETQKEALIFHELKHCEMEEKETKKGLKNVMKTVPHHFEGFVDEYEKFGDWRNDLPELNNNEKTGEDENE